MKFKCTCYGAMPNPECNYDHASENERIEALRLELGSIQAFVAESLQCLDYEVMAILYLELIRDGHITDRHDFGVFVFRLIYSAVCEYTDYTVASAIKNNHKTHDEIICGAMDGEIGALNRLIAMYRSQTV